MNFQKAFTLITLTFLSFCSSICAQETPDMETPMMEKVKNDLLTDYPPIEEYFDFWVGDWKVWWEEGEGKKGTGTNTITKILGGKGIQEDFKILTGQSKGFLGTSISILESKQKKWKQTWMDSSGSYFDFDGKIENGNPIFQTKMVEKDDQQIIRKMTFKDITKKGFTWDWEGTQDGGKTWKLLWRVYYEAE